MHMARFATPHRATSIDNCLRIHSAIAGKVAFRLLLHHPHTGCQCAFTQADTLLNMHVLIIDDAPDFRALASQFVAIEWPDAQVEEYDPVAQGFPAADFAWDDVDVVLLDFMLGMEDGLDWLRRFRAIAVMPPIIFLTGSGSENVAAKAIKLGATDYLRKHDLSRQRLVEAIRECLQGAGKDEASAPTRDDTPANEFAVRPAVGSTVEAIHINGYRILRKLGEGGMAVVFLTEHLKSGAERVLKILDTRISTDPAFLDRFIHEYGVISKIDSPYVVRIHDQGFTSDHAYISMEHLPGGDLKDRIAAGLRVDDALRIFRQLIQALKAVHDAGIVHRDLKPHNIMFRADGSIALLDFGVARDTEVEHNITHQGFVIGTPNYMSPEQAEGRRVDYRSDLYSAGAILFEMLTGKPPYEADSMPGLMYAHINSPIPQLPRPLAEYQILIDRLMAKKPEQRYQSALELLPDQN